MCGRYRLFITLDELVERYGLDEANIDFAPREEIFPSEKAPVITSQNNQRQLQLFKWGFTTSFSKRLIINSRAETVDSKPTFAEAFKHKRCLIPATGFFEWQQAKNKKIKYLITLKESFVFSFAGIYDTFQTVDGQLFHAFSIITTNANHKIQQIHDRMPVILETGMEDNWLYNDNPADLKKLLKPFSAKSLQLTNKSNQLKLDFD